MLKALLKNEITQDDFIRYYDIIVLLKKLPKNVHGLAFKKNNNFVVINSLLGEENKKKALLHEFAHIELNHLDKDFFKTKIKDLEDEADIYINELLNSLV